MPLIMGMIAGATACVLGTIAVLSVYAGVSITSQVSSVGGSHDQLATLAYAGVCTIVASLVFVYFDHSSELQTNTLREDKDRIQKEALTDALTGCANRRAFMHAVRRGREDMVGVVIIDLDRFKQINDTFGHQAGDRVLSVFADRLKIIVGQDRSVYRLGGDEFAIIQDNLASEDAMRLLGEQIVSATDVPISMSDGNLEFDASIGIAITSETVENLETLYQQADTALFAAKKQPGANYIIFDSMLDGTATRMFEVEQCLKSAIEQRSIKIAMQPQVDLKNGSIVGYEALARWDDPLLGKVSPSEFVPIAERSSLIEVLDRQVIAKAMHGASDLLIGSQKISINVSARSLNSKDFSKFIQRQLERSRVQPKRVELEITETALIENWERAKCTVAELRANGVGIALDDFGVGYSSLSYLTEFPIQKIKFDRSFVQRSSDRSAALVMESIVDLAKKMNLELVAEGIETKDQLALVRKLGCSVGQGFLLGRPSLRGESVIDTHAELFAA
ncbi:MAG: EAL domain-containing protein [Pseudomonadota bacterium]